MAADRLQVGDDGRVTLGGRFVDLDRRGGAKIVLVDEQSKEVDGIIYRWNGVLMFIDEIASWGECITDYGDIIPRGEGRAVDLGRDRFMLPAAGTAG